MRALSDATIEAGPEGFVERMEAALSDRSRSYQSALTQAERAEKERDEARRLHGKHILDAGEQINAIRRRSLEAGNLERLIAEHGLPAAMRWVVDGEAPEDQCKRGPHHVAEHAQGGRHMLCGADGVLTQDGLRWPCSPACTHDDAATPGHPERVKEQSEAVMWSIVAPDAPPERVGERSEELDRAMNDSLGSPQVVESRAKTEWDAAWEQGAEAMRAACLEVVLVWMQERGIPLLAQADMKKVIEGAAP